MVVYLFPGQGAQARGMGADLFDEFVELTRTADAILGYSVRDLCVRDPDGRLNQTRYTQPAIYVANALSYYRLLREGDGPPRAVSGHSLGEYNALLAAEVFDFADGLRLVKKRGELMAEAEHGGMAAVLGKTEKEVRDLVREERIDALDVANLNAPKQIVLSGPRGEIEAAKAVFTRDSSCQYVPLPVSGAFHSRYMADAQREFADYLDGFDLGAPRLPVIANVTARRYRPDEVKETLTAQIVSAVKWSETIRYLLGQGEEEFVEVGPGRILTSLLRTIRREAEPLVVNGEDLESPAVTPSVEAASPTPKGHAVHRAPRTPSTAVAQEPERGRVQAADLGSASFKRDYGLRYACLVGGMHRGISSAELVAEAGRAGMMGFLSTSGRPSGVVEKDLRWLRESLAEGEAYGANLAHDSERDDQLVDLFLRYEARVVEASGFISVGPALVRYRLSGAYRDPSGRAIARNRVIAKVSRPEVATAFLSPAPPKVVDALLAGGQITAGEAELAAELPVAEDLCCEADSGGHTDKAVALSLLPAMLRLRDAMVARHAYPRPIRLGAAGGIGTPDAAAACLVMGADFIVTGSINQCTVEAATSDAVKDLLQDIDIQDTGYAPAGDTMEYGTQVQVLRKGVLFPPRANKLYELYKSHAALDEIDAETAEQVQRRYLKKRFGEVFAELRTSLPVEEIERAERDPKHKMALVFRWYFEHALGQALSGSSEGRVDFQVHCGPALGSFNQWVKGTELEVWQRRHVADINLRILREAADLLTRRLNAVATG